MKQIEINYLTSTGYESLYPNVNCASITDFAENLYSKSEVDEMIQQMKDQTGDLKFAMGDYIGTTQLTQSNSSWRTINTGFKPSYFLISVKDTKYYAPHFFGGDSAVQGFGAYFSIYGQQAIQPIENGFQVRNAYYRNGNYGYNIALDEINCTYSYCVFG